MKIMFVGFKKYKAICNGIVNRKNPFFRQSVWREQTNIFIGIFKPFFDDGQFPSNALEQWFFGFGFFFGVFF